ncbi:MAG: Ppx/GppA family phosphatase [Verrucomicrobia bacterium]|nr:Ppx/GppA family phosphatase [Verrucomicrobiota bacterium]
MEAGKTISAKLAADKPSLSSRSVRRAVIDVGTNSIKLLVADVAGHHVQPLWEDSKQTRLGSGFYETHILQPNAIAQTAAAVTDFAAKAREWNAASIRIFATSAARDAVNAADLVSAIEHASGLEVKIISGEQEADWVFKGVTTDAELARQPLLILDVGGGSTEFILGHGEHKDFRHSFPLGTVRLLEKMPHSDPPTVRELVGCRNWLKHFLETEVRPKLEPSLRQEIGLIREHRPVLLVGTGGTTSILARMEAKLETYDRERIEATRLSLERVRWHSERLWSLPLAERKQIVGLPKKRADVILPGVAIYEAVMEQFGFSELRVSTRGLRFAAVMDGG